MIKNNKQIKKEIEKLNVKIDRLSKSNNFDEIEGGESVSALVRYMMEEREKTNKMLKSITERLKSLEDELKGVDEAVGEEVGFEYKQQPQNNREIPLSNLDSKILEFAQSKGMVCADDIKGLMQYKGRNAACARLNRLYRAGLLDRFQLGHRVYFKYDAGKTTNTLIISPPQ